MGYRALADVVKPDEVHIEQLVRTTHIHTHWSVGVIVTAFPACPFVRADISIVRWEKFCDWHGDRGALKRFAKHTQTEDELAAIGMGYFYTQEMVYEQTKDSIYRHRD